MSDSGMRLRAAICSNGRPVLIRASRISPSRRWAARPAACWSIPDAVPFACQGVRTPANQAGTNKKVLQDCENRAFHTCASVGNRPNSLLLARLKDSRSGLQDTAVVAPPRGAIQAGAPDWRQTTLNGMAAATVHRDHSRGLLCSGRYAGIHALREALTPPATHPPYRPEGFPEHCRIRGERGGPLCRLRWLKRSTARLGDSIALRKGCCGRSPFAGEARRYLMWLRRHAGIIAKGVGTGEIRMRRTQKPSRQHADRRNDEIHSQNNNSHGKWHSIKGKQGVHRKGHDTGYNAEDCKDEHHRS